MLGIEIHHLAVVGTLVLLEGLLSADNALVLAIQVRHLPAAQRRRALLYGMGGAIALRAVFILLAKTAVSFWWLAGLGALYLIGCSFKHFWEKHQNGRSGAHEKPTRSPLGFWQTVAIVELTDIFFAIDSIFVAVAFTNNLYVIYAGAFLGIVLLRLAAGVFIRLLEKFPALDDMAYGLVGWAGLKLAAKATQLFWIHSGYYTRHTVPHLMPEGVFWSGMALIVAAGVWNARRHKAPPAQTPTTDA